MIREGILDGLRPGIRDAALRIEERFSKESFGGELLIYCGFRTPQEQAIIYRKGRSRSEVFTKADELERKYGRADLADTLRQAPSQSDQKVITNAGPGQSAHNYGEAFDAVPLIAGKPVWLLADPLYQLYGKISEEEGLVWAGKWRTFREGPHSQSISFDWRKAIVLKGVQ